MAGKHKSKSPVPMTLHEQDNISYQSMMSSEYSISRRPSAVSIHSLRNSPLYGHSPDFRAHTPITPDSVSRILLLSTFIKSATVLETAAHRDVMVYPYEQDGKSLADIVKTLKQKLRGVKVKSVGLVTNGEPGGIALNAAKFCTVETLRKDNEIREFWMLLAELLGDSGEESEDNPCRIDILANSVCSSKSGVDMIASIQAFTGVRMFVCNDILGNDVKFWGK